MDLNNEDKVVLITGSSSGIGAATAKLFASRGYKVSVTGKNEARVNEIAAECEKLNPARNSIQAIVSDVGITGNAEYIVQQCLSYHGHIDVLVNNVGVYHKTNAADKSSYTNYKLTMEINCDSVIKTTQEAIPHLVERQGNIVFVSSVASVKPSSNGYAYRMSKAAISSYAKCLAVDMAGKLRVNIVSPGPTSTPLFEKAGITEEQLKAKVAPSILLGRVGETEEIAKAIYFLASNDASFVNGSELFVDGGYLCSPPGRS